MDEKVSVEDLELTEAEGEQVVGGMAPGPITTVPEVVSKVTGGLGSVGKALHPYPDPRS